MKITRDKKSAQALIDRAAELDVPAPQKIILIIGALHSSGGFFTFDSDLMARTCGLTMAELELHLNWLQESGHISVMRLSDGPVRVEMRY